MRTFFKNVVVVVSIFVCWFALYQIKQAVDAYSFSWVVTSISSGVLYSSWTQFDVSFVGLSGHSNWDKLKAFLSDSLSTGDLNTKPRTNRITLGAAQPGWTWTINVWTWYENFTWDTLYLHILVTASDEATFKWGWEQEISFVWWGGGGMPDILINELALHASGDFVELMALTGAQGINLTGWNAEIYSSTGELMSTQPLDWFLPKYGLLTFSYDLDDDGGRIKIKNTWDDTKAELSYGIYNTGTYGWSIGVNQSTEAIRSGTWITFAVTGNITRWRFRGAQDATCSEINNNFDENFIPTLSSIAVCLLSEQGINTNLWTLADPTNTPATGANRLYFEKIGIGNLIFNEHINLTDQNTVKIVQAMWQQLNMQSAGKIWFDANMVESWTTFDSTVLEQASATVIMYNVNQLGVYEALSSGFIMSKDSDSDILLSGVDVPDLTSFAYTGLNSGSLSFITNHFTSFEIARVRNITQTIGYDTIQEAIDSVSSWDIITVASGVYTENIELKNWPFTLSWLDSPTIDGTITLKNSNNGEQTIIIQGFAPMNTLYADLGLYSTNQYYTLRDAIGYITSGGTIVINGWSAGGEFAYVNYMEDDQVTIDKPMSIIGTGTYRPNIYFDDTWTWWWLLINNQNVTIRNINFYANYSPVEVAIQIQQATGVIFNNCVFDSLILENTDTTLLIATGNYRWWTPVLGTDYSWNVSYIPRYWEEACTTLVDDDASLSNLIASGRTLSWSFSSGVTWYTINVPYQRTGTITVTPITNTSWATRTGDNYITLLTWWSTGSIVITVTASDTTTTTDYTIIIVRDPASTDATLSALTVSTWTLDPSFSSGVTWYEVNFPFSWTGLVTITWTKNYTYAVIIWTSLSLDLTAAGQTWSMFITVQSESGDTQTYTVTITRSPPSTDANLSSLTVSTWTLSWAFSSWTYTYTVNFSHQYTGSVSITWTVYHPYAFVSSWSYSLNLSSAGQTWSMFITVQSESGDTQTYTVTITRSPPSTDANLSSLTVSTWTLSWAFSSWTTSYILQMLYSYIGTITSTPIANNAFATITGTTSLTLETAGSTWVLESTVTAEDETTTKTYTINITRADPPSADIDAIDGTVTITWWSATISWFTATGATFASTGTLHIIWDTTNDYLEISVSWFIITASGWTWDGVLLSPIDLLTWDNNNATLWEIWLTNTSTTTYTFLLTIEAGSNTDSLTASGGYFNISFVVPWGTNGDVINLYRSENGSTWTANTPDASCTLNSSLVCTFRTDHLSYFAAVEVTTSSGGWSNWGWWGISLAKDNCPDGDLSSSFYDGTCEKPKTTSKKLSGEVEGIVLTSWDISHSTYSREFNQAYLFAFQYGITTQSTIQKANMEGMLTRAHMAKMMVNYAINVLDKTPNTWLVCSFADISNQSSDIQLYIKLACQLGLMGVGISNFDPNGEVTRAQFGTVLSRTLYGDIYNNWVPFYSKHLDALKLGAIITNDDPYLKELRGYVMLMLMRTATN